jgi:hypothetical protein
MKAVDILSHLRREYDDFITLINRHIVYTRKFEGQQKQKTEYMK